MELFFAKHLGGGKMKHPESKFRIANENSIEIFSYEAISHHLLK